MQFVFRAVDEVGATLNTALVVMGDKLGLYRALAGAGGLTPAELAERTGTAERYVREWLNAQAAGGYVDVRPGQRPLLAAARADRRADRHRAARPTCPGFFQIALGSVIDSPRIIEAARSGDGVGWHEHVHDVHEGCERFFRPGYNAHLIAEWLPALDGVVAKLERGAHGRRRRLRARRLDDPDGAGVPAARRSSAPTTTTGSIETARARAAGGRASPTGCASRSRRPPAYSGDGYDLVTMFDCLHDMGDPVGAARHVRETLAPDGTWMIVEPNAGDRVEDNLNPVGRAYYGFSTLLCTPASLSQEVGLALGAQAGEARIREVVTAGGLHPLPPRGRDAVQPGVRGAAVTRPRRDG